MKRLAGGLCAVGCLVFAAVPAWADDEQGLKGEIQVLKERLAQLEARLEKAETGALLPPTGGEPGPAVGIPPNLHIHGFAEASYLYNWNAPQTRVNTLRTFDTEAHGFTPHKFDLTVQSPLTDDQPVGFRTDVVVGDDAEIIGSAGLGSTADEIDLKQAYVLARAPIGEGLDFKIGKFVTLLGSEVIEDIDSFNWNFSHSYLFGYAIPFTHTGVLMSYPFAKQVAATVGVVNGWDNVDDNNGAKTLLGQLSLSPSDQVTLYYNTVFGAEQGGNNNNQRFVNDLVLLWKPTEQLQLMLNYDYGWEDDAVALTKNANWTGLAEYIRYQLTDWWALAFRGEWFHDANGVRTGFSSGINGVAGNDVNLYEYTFTNEFKVFKNLITRLEYRHDQSSERIFRSGDLAQRSHQDTIGVQVIYPF